jgi:hypothetical protein
VGGGSGKAPTLAEGLLYQHDAGAYRKELDAAAALTPAQVRDVTGNGSRPTFALTVEPGTRTEGGEHRGGFLTDPKSPSARPPSGAIRALRMVRHRARGPAPDRSELPPVGQLSPLVFPKIERHPAQRDEGLFRPSRRRAGGIGARELRRRLCRRSKNALGTEALLLKLMNEGTTTLDSSAFARARERLGAASREARTPIRRSSSMRLRPISLPRWGCWRTISSIRRWMPANSSACVPQLTAISGEMKDPTSLAFRCFTPRSTGRSTLWHSRHWNRRSGRRRAPLAR